MQCHGYGYDVYVGLEVGIKSTAGNVQINFHRNAAMLLCIANFSQK